MSVDLYLRCTNCNESIWIGQRDHLYTALKYLDALQEFLFKHKSEYEPEHHLVFVDEQVEDYLHYKEHANVSVQG